MVAMSEIDSIEKLKIGYGGISKNFCTPQDRRRFGFWASKRKVTFELADPSKQYDLVILPQMADLSQWINYPYKKSKIVFDFIDSYLAIPYSDWRGLFRGTAKYISGQNRYLYLNHWTLLKKMCQRADAVVCTTEEQKKEISKYCPNVFINLDDQSEFAGKKKSNYTCGQTFNIFWEGQGGNIWTFNNIRKAIEEIESNHTIAIHMMTDLTYAVGLGNIGVRSSSKAVKQIFPRTKVYLYEWNPYMISTLAASCDLAVIPIPLDNSLYRSKSANKLLICWRMGLPVITSSTPAYVREMQRAGIDNMCCTTTEDWIQVLGKMIEDEKARSITAEKGFSYVECEYSSNQILNKWDEIFRAVLG